MPSFETSRRVHHTAAQMFALVADIEAYPQFLPLCKALRVTRRSTQGETETLVADMEVGYKAIRERFTSRVTLNRAQSRIDVEYVDGPFSQLENRWTFRPDGEGGCLVEFFITYEFRSRVLGLLMGSMFDAAFRKFSESFERRADLIYKNA